ncbi:hypothetical protein [Pseudoalteromonas sp. NZS100]|uniref:hypothetical protein n=1 Tax=Pseudoalteromonas sp. NZS100 TaxID=2792046 RepID=UPI0018CCFC1C|nr:hypothetical protein [Pseudoalteromonas sp. NZS100]MBH0066776.1 hypothetical protein [Pseudoalteromonas sp. NZS100]
MIKRGLIFTLAISSALLGCDKQEIKVETVQLTPPPAEFISPYRFLKFRISAASDILKVAPDANGSIVTSTNQYETRYESNDGIITYSEIALLETAPCSQTQEFDPIAMLNAVAVDVRRLEPQMRMTHVATYYDHSNKLKVSVTCQQDGMPIIVAFSNKYYGY